MKKKYAFILNILLVSSLLLFGCSKDDKDIEVDNGSSNTVIKDDLELTISSAKNTYSMDMLFSSEPLDIVATVKYIGDKDSITIQHPDPLCAIALCPKDKGTALGGDVLDIEMTSTLIKDEILTFSPDYQRDYYKENLTKGQYTAVAYLRYSLEGEEEVGFLSEITFEIK